MLYTEFGKLLPEDGAGDGQMIDFGRCPGDRKSFILIIGNSRSGITFGLIEESIDGGRTFTLFGLLI